MQKLLLTGDYPIIASPVLVKEYGMAAATLLQKLHYALSKSATKKWYHTYTDWIKTIGMYSVSTIKRAVKKLKDAGIITTEKLSKSEWIHTLSYSINYSKLKQLFNDVIEDQKIKIAQPPKQKPAPVMQLENLVGTQKPTSVPTDQEIQALSKDIRDFYNLLRARKVDVDANDQRLFQWIKNRVFVLAKVSHAKQSGIAMYQWHTPEQLKI